VASTLSLLLVRRREAGSCFLRTVPFGATLRRGLFGLSVFGFLLVPTGRSQSTAPLNVPLVQMSHCSGRPTASLQNYDRLLEEFLNEGTRHPVDNSQGNVAFGTRYYMESLLTAYEATGNPKYIQAFLDSGQSVMNLVQTMTILDVPDPSAPGRTGPWLSVMGWPTVLGSFGIPVAIPTASGQIAVYGQNLEPTDPGGPVYLQVAQRSDGTIDLAWVGASGTIETEAIGSMSDLDIVASAPLINTPNGLSPGRLVPTGLGLPAPGKYLIDAPLQTIWQEQTGGILLPFVHFLLLAKEHHGIADEATLQEWRSEILAIAASYEDDFVSDGDGGLRFHNPVWLPNLTADIDAAMDYISVEATLRLFLYELTGDAHQLAIAKGLILHQRNFHWRVSPQGWFLLQLWPDFIPWSSRANAPAGNILDLFQFDPSTPASVTDGGFFADLLHYARVFRLERELGVREHIYDANREAFQQYLFYASGSPPNGSETLLRENYPTANSTAADAINPSQDPFAGAGFLTPEVADQAFIHANWNWMLSYGQDPHDGSIGYFLRAWARSEAAELEVCKYAKKPAHKNEDAEN